jgi:hypothetical protein
MTRATLVDQIDSTQFSEDAADMFVKLSSFDASDEGAAVVLAAAAQLLARQHAYLTARDADALLGLCDEFTDLVFTWRVRLGLHTIRPALRVVGGTDVL